MSRILEESAADGRAVLSNRLASLGARDPALLAAGRGTETLAAMFHNALAAGSLEIARRAGLNTVVLGGGCFQNRLLTERVTQLLVRDGFRVLACRHVPPGDGGLAVGQIWAAALRLCSS